MFYDTIMLAADHIGRNPREYDFYIGDIPEIGEIPEGPVCGSPSCALGWIGALAGLKEFLDIDQVAKAMGTSEIEFYRRMHELDPTDEWYDDAAVCASTLCKYAEKYHGHERQVQELKASLQSLPETEAA